MSDAEVSISRKVYPFEPHKWLVGFGVCLSVVMHLRLPDIFLRFGKSLGLLGNALTDDKIRKILVLSIVALTAVWAVLRLTIIIGRKLREPALQEDRTRFANEIYKNLVAHGSGAPEYSLLLRPFFVDGNFKNSMHVTQVEAWSQGATSTFEARLADALDRESPLLCIGKRTPAIGPGIVIVEDSEWEEAFFLLAKQAKSILVVPMAQHATAWEIETLKLNALLEKTIFMVPPQRKIEKNKFNLDPNATETRDIYKLSREYFSALGLEMPSFHKRGQLFRLNATGRVIQNCKMGLFDKFAYDAPSVIRRWNGAQVG